MPPESLPGSHDADRLPSDQALVYATLIVKPFRVESVLRALEPFRIRLLTQSEVRGYGRQKGHLELYQGREYAISFIPKVKIEIVLPQGEVEAMLQAVSTAARTGRIGDGKVFLFHGESFDFEAD